MRTRTTLATLSLLAVAAVAGCGSDDDGGDAVLSKAELESALITADDLGSGFVTDDDDDDDDDSDLGCLNGLDKLEDNGADPVRDVDAAFEAEDEPNLPGVFATIGSFKTDAEAAQVLTEFTEAVADCKQIDVTDKDGFTIKLDVTSDDDKTDPGATGQVNLEATGTAGGEGLTFPFALRFSAIQIDNNVTVVGYVSMVAELGDDADAVAQRAYDRLAPVAAGKKAPDLDPLDLETVDLQSLVGGAGSAA